ncbi:hypothetical protein HDU82_005424 [Entophlyctis luteolus]|nr:hypothetical protein HDU82_005424 [Entophlyctis luteolus]
MSAGSDVLPTVRWSKSGTLLIGNFAPASLESSHPPVAAREKVAAFDFDGTIAQTAGTHIFSKSADDWRFVFPNVPDVVRKAYSDGFRIIIFSNQKGLYEGKGSKLEIFKGKVQHVARAFNVPLLVFASTEGDVHRKPQNGMWEFFISNHVDAGVNIDISSSFFVGDAAGRPDRTVAGKFFKKDHSAADLKFARNIGLLFHLPEVYFKVDLDAAKHIPTSWEFDPTKYAVSPVSQGNGKSNFASLQPGIELVIFVGPPASGKTRFFKLHFLPHQYVHVNQDTLKDRKKCVAAARAALAAKSSVVIDNTNPTSAVRSEYIAVAKELGVSRIRAFVFNTPLEICEHNNMHRVEVTKAMPYPRARRERIPTMVFRKFFKDVEPPTANEGFIEIQRIEFSPEFADAEERRLWSRFYGSAWVFGPDFYNNTIDLFLEAWPEDTANYDQVTQVDRVAVDLGAMGYSGVIGLYVPDALYYTPKQCQSANSTCVEMWAYDPVYSPSNYQRLIDSLNLNLTIKFLGYGAQATMQAALDAGQNVLLYNWAPSAFIASNNVTKVLFAATDPAQYINLANNRASAYVTTDIPTIIIHKLATRKFMSDFPELQSFANQYQILDARLNDMLKSTVTENLNYSQAACKWVQNNRDIWEPWIPAIPKSVVTNYIYEDQVNGILSIPGLSTFLAIASLNIDGMVTDCTLPISGVSKAMFRFFLPSLILFYIILIYLGMRFFQGSGIIPPALAEKFTPYYMKGQSSTLICFRAAIVVLTLQCTEVLGNTVLRTSPTITCFGPEHRGAAAFAIIILFIFLIIVPIMIALILMKLAKSNNIKYDQEGISNIQKLFQCLYIVFKPEMYYMMPITIIEKGVTSILFTMLVKFDEMIQINIYIIFLGFICATRIYWQPYHNHLEAYLNREISLGILILISFRQYTDQYGVTQSALAQIGIVIFLPLVLHIIRWTISNFDKHQEVILDTLASKNLISKQAGSRHGSRNAIGEQSDSQNSLNKGKKKNMRGSIEKITSAQVKVARTTSMMGSQINPGEREPLNRTDAP